MKLKKWFLDISRPCLLPFSDLKCPPYFVLVPISPIISGMQEAKRA
jgi:hypothetical protein